MSVTIRDVAKAAGVSPMSVSKVLHGRGRNVRVSEETAAVIRRVAAELDYRPNVLARNFRQRRTRGIGLIFETVPVMTGPNRYFSDLIDGVTTAAFEVGYSVTLCSSLLGDNALASVSDGRFDGLLWCRNEQNWPLLEAIDRSSAPVVVLHEPPTGREDAMNHVVWDNARAVQMAVSHLVTLGHQRIAFLDDFAHRGNTECVLRRQAFERIITERNLDGEHLAWSNELAELEDWHQKSDRSTAIVVWNESTAVTLLQRARALGISIPQDFSVIAFDSTFQCELTEPRLTGVHQPLTEMAREATRLLLQLIESPAQKPQHIVFPCRLDVRESTAPNQTRRT